MHKTPPFLAAIALIACGVTLALAVAAPATAQINREQASQVVATINGQEVTLNLVGSLISQLPPQYRNQTIEVLYSRVVDDIIDTKLAADAARESGLADNPLLNEIAQRAYERVLAEAWINVQLRERISPDMVNTRYEEIIAGIDGDDKPTIEQLRGRIIAELSVQIVDGIAADLKQNADITRKDYREVVPADDG